MEDTPTSKARSAAVGLVELSGTAKPRKEMTAPVSKLPCCWWRCVVEERRSSGKNKYWATVGEMSSRELFYFQDATGQVLIDPEGAELHVDENVFGPDDERIVPALTGFGLSPQGWFNTWKAMRITEQVVFPNSPLYILGEFSRREAYQEDRSQYLEHRKQRCLERLRELKKDPVKMAEADVNKDGMVDPAEWDYIRAKHEELFLQEEAAREPQVPECEKLVIRKPEHHPYILATKHEKALVRSFGLWSVLGVWGGIVITGIGVWLAFLKGFSPELIILMSGAGLAAGAAWMVYKQRKGGRPPWV